MRRLAGTCCLGLLVAMVWATAAFAVEGPGNYRLESASALLSDTQAGAHPDFTTVFHLSETKGAAYANTRDIFVRLPAGVLGNPQGFPKCNANQFGTAPPLSACPVDSQVGSTTVLLGGAYSGTFTEPVYNMPAPGGDVIARFGFFAAAYPMLIDVRLDPATETLVASIDDAPAAAGLIGASTTLWGVPSAPVHDPERLTPEEVLEGGGPPGGRPSTLPDTPFMTNPTSCGEERKVTFTAVSYQLPEAPSTITTPYPAVTGCSLLEFNPATLLEPTTSQGTTGTGLDYELGLPTNGLQVSTLDYGSELKRSEVVLPRGMTINPSEAVGLGVCSEADLARETYDSGPNIGCPETSKIGSVIANSPVVDRVAGGSLYIAKPYENPFGSLLALYMVVKIPDRGVLVKLPGRIALDQETGQITATFDNIPQLPIASFHLHFREGARAPLITPYACGNYVADSNMNPWSEPGVTVTKENTFAVESGPGHTQCPSSSTPPFSPAARAGTENNAAGSYSPVDLRITRSDGEQEITKFSTVMPPGLTGNLSGIPFCPDAAIEAAKHKTGHEELADPSCPAASEIGHSFTGAGVGEVLAQTPGKVYLAGPYHGASLSLVSITSASVGPFDLGTVVIRFALRINPITAQVEVDSNGSDPIPHILDGIVVHVRDIRVYIDRHDFTLNPTNCEPLVIENAITGAGADIASTADDTTVTVPSRFQAAECQSLAFKPSFKVSTAGKTSRVLGAGLHVSLTYPTDALGKDANIKSVRVELPKQLPSRLTTLQKACTSRQFQTNPAGCPAASRVGTAKAITPILPVPLEGPAYFVSYGGAQFPELVLVLQGYGITIDLHGETFIDERTNVTSSTFHTVPDQPVQSFELTLPQGPDSALAATGNLCTTNLAMPTAFTAQNGLTLKQSTPIEVDGCPYTLTIVAHKVTSRTLTLKVVVPAAGKLVATGSGVSRATANVNARRAVALKLKQRRAGKLRSKITLRFTPRVAIGKQRGKQGKPLRKAITVAFR